MKVCVFGAGAIGGFVAAKLSAAGAEVSCVARGPHLAAIKANGLTLKSGGETLVVHPRVTDDARELGPQDYVIIAVKAHAIPAAAPSIRHLLGEHTALCRRSTASPGGTSTSRVGRSRERGYRAWIREASSGTCSRPAG